MNNNEIKMLFIVGPTAVGKTELGIRLARVFNGEIVSADSRQVYCGLDIGTGKDLEAYRIGGKPVIHYLIDIITPEDNYNLLRFCRDASEIIKGICRKGCLPIMVGGTVLYINAILSGYRLPGGPPDAELRESLKEMEIPSLLEILREKSPETYEKTKDKNNRTRIVRAIEKIQTANMGITLPTLSVKPLIIGVYFPREEVHKRIENRLKQRFASGMIEEVQKLHDNSLPWERLEYFGLEYRYIAYYLQGKLGLEEMKKELLAKIRQLAKKQDIWFRRMEKEGHVIHWIQRGNFIKAANLVRRFLQNDSLPEPRLRLSEIYYGSP